MAIMAFYYFPKGIHSGTYNVNLLFPSDYPPMEMPSGNSLMELLDVIVLLYNLSSHDQLFKVSCLTLALCIMLGFFLSESWLDIFSDHNMSVWIIVFMSVSHAIYWFTWHCWFFLLLRKHRYVNFKVRLFVLFWQCIFLNFWNSKIFKNPHLSSKNIQ